MSLGGVCTYFLVQGYFNRQRGGFQPSAGAAGPQIDLVRLTYSQFMLKGLVSSTWKAECTAVKLVGAKDG